MKIYVVTQGYYSDYSIITATTDRNLAEVIAKKFGRKDDSTRIEVFEDAEVVLKPCWFVLFGKDGAVVRVVECSDDSYGYERLNMCSVDVVQQLSVHVLADDSASAVKIAAEKRAQFLAETEGL